MPALEYPALRPSFKRGLAQGRALLVVEIGSRSAFHHFLVAALHRAIALEQVHQIAVFVAEDLDLDVAGTPDQALKVDLVITECRTGFAAPGGPLVAQFILGFHDAHAATAATPTGLEHQGVADFGGDALHLVEIVGQGAGGRHHGDSRRLGQRAGADLVAQRPHNVGMRADEENTVLRAGFRQVRVFGEKAVTRMDSIHASFLGDPHDFVDIQVGRDGLLAPAHFVGFIGLEAVEGEAVFLRIDGDVADAEFAGGAHDANGDLAAIGNQQAVDFPVVGVGHDVPFGMGSGVVRGKVAGCARSPGAARIPSMGDDGSLSCRGGVGSALGPGVHSRQKAGVAANNQWSRLTKQNLWRGKYFFLIRSTGSAQREKESRAALCGPGSQRE